MNIYDIAEAADVSIATVSRVMSGSDKVSGRTRDRVLAVIDELGYVPNAFARGLGLGSMKMIGILCTDISDIFYAKAVSNLEHLLSQHGLNSLLYCTGDELEAKRKGLDILLSKKVDAIILVGSSLIELKDNAHLSNAARQAPIFCVNGMVDDENIYCVACDERRAMYENTTQLLESGCQHVAYLYDSATPSGLQKLAGYREAVTDRLGIVDQELILRTEANLEETACAVDQLIGTRTVDGIVASEDILAIGACKALAARGMAVPTIGFNNSILAQCATPALTSMDNMLESICNMAISLLVDVLDGKEAPHAVSLTGHLVQRETFRLPPPSAE